jgi:hypothetical protein
MDSDPAITTPSQHIVDRPARDALVELVTVFLHNETGSRELNDRQWQTLADTADASVRMMHYDLCLLLDDFTDHSRAVPRETWDWLIRVIAFLHTDFELTSERRSMWHRKQLVAAGGLLLIGCGATMSLVVANWLPVIFSWAVAGTLAIAYWQLHDGYYVHPEIEALGRFAPFRSEAQWRNYEHLAAAEKLPAYDPAVHNQPPRTDAELKQITCKRLLLAPLYGALCLPWMLRRVGHEIHVVEAEEHKE